MTKYPTQAFGSISSGSVNPLLDGVAAVSDEMFEAARRVVKAQEQLLKALQQLTRAVLGRGDQDATDRDELPSSGDDGQGQEEEPAGEQARDDSDELAGEQLGEVDEAEDIEDEADDEAVDEAEDVEDEADDEAVDGQVGSDVAPAPAPAPPRARVRAKAAAPAAGKRSTHGRRIGLARPVVR